MAVVHGIFHSKIAYFHTPWIDFRPMCSNPFAPNHISPDDIRCPEWYAEISVYTNSIKKRSNANCSRTTDNFRVEIHFNSYKYWAFVVVWTSVSLYTKCNYIRHVKVISMSFFSSSFSVFWLLCLVLCSLLSTFCLTTTSGRTTINLCKWFISRCQMSTDAHTTATATPPAYEPYNSCESALRPKTTQIANCILVAFIFSFALCGSN